MRRLQKRSRVAVATTSLSLSCARPVGEQGNSGALMAPSSRCGLARPPPGSTGRRATALGWSGDERPKASALVVKARRGGSGTRRRSATVEVAVAGSATGVARSKPRPPPSQASQLPSCVAARRPLLRRAVVQLLGQAQAVNLRVRGREFPNWPEGGELVRQCRATA